MVFEDFLQIGIFLLIVLVMTPIIGYYIYHIFAENAPKCLPMYSLIEKGMYKLNRINLSEDMSWKAYASAVIWFNAFGVLFLTAILMLQGKLPLNPQHFQGLHFLLAINTAISFVTNTNWQAYAGETTLSYLSQMSGLTVQNFLSAATGIAVVMALIRGFTRHSVATIGNFWSDIIKAVVYVLLPLSIIFALVLVQQGVIQNFNPYTEVVTIDKQKQVIPSGPVASQLAIKQLGTNGGGFFNVNSGHPFENPTPLTNFLEILAILLIPASLTYTFGQLTGSARQGWVIFGAMYLVFVILLCASIYSEYQYNPLLGIAGSMEGKEVRFGIAGSSLFSVATTVTSCGAVNCMHESLSPIGGLITIFNMMLGEVIFGGIGSGLYGMLLYAIITVFIAGLMVGRTPEFLGKKIHVFEIKMSVIGILAPSVVILLFAAIACSSRAGTTTASSQGLAAFNEILYAFTSAANNNGSAFAGLGASTTFYTLTTAIAMLIGRFATIIPVLAIAGSLAGKKATPPSSGTFPTDGVLFLVLLIGTIIVVGALNFFPVLAIGPLVEHLLLLQGKGF